MATARNKKGRFSKTGVVPRAKRIGELKTSVVKGKPLIHTVEENKDEPHYHNVSGEKLLERSRIIDLLFVIKQLKDGCTVCGEFQNIAYLETETIIGLASIFYLKCICDNINAIYSGQYHIKCRENRECKIFQSAENHRIFSSKLLEFESTSFHLFSLRMMFDSSKFESLRDVSVTRIGDTLPWFSAD